MCPLKDDVRKLTKQPKLTAIIQSLRLTLFGHIMRMDNNAQHHPTGSETSPSYAPRSSRFGSELPSEEEDVDVWRYAIVSCIPETTMTIKWLTLSGLLFHHNVCAVTTNVKTVTLLNLSYNIIKFAAVK